MNGNAADVVVVGGGIAGIATAYYLGRAGVKSVVVERDGLASHASGFAYGGLDGVGETALAAEGMRLHRALSETLLEDTGIDTEFRARPSLSLAFTEAEAAAARTSPSLDSALRWVDAHDVKSIEPRVAQDALGGLYTDATADLDPYRFVLAVATAAESLGATIRYGRVSGLRWDGDRVAAVTLNGEEITCGAVVIAMGPWSQDAAAWLDVPIGISPLKGQILRLRASDAPYRCSIAWKGNYASTKPDGLVWAGTTEEEAGFDETLTTEARDSIMASLLKMLPSLADAQLVRQTACLRPLSSDLEPVLGRLPGWENAYIATGAGRKGIVLGPAMGKAVADLVTTGATEIPIDAYDPGRFGSG